MKYSFHFLKKIIHFVLKQHFMANNIMANIYKVIAFCNVLKIYVFKNLF
jgi:hypothetical protein